jgi:hypothetical protein
MERLLRFLHRVSSFREVQVKKIIHSDNVMRDSGRFTSVNITMISGGKQANVIPDEVTASKGRLLKMWALPLTSAVIDVS